MGTSEECKRVEQEAGQAQELLHQCRTRLRQLLDEIRQLVRTIKQVEVKIPKLEMEISGCDTTREELTNLIPELKSNCDLSDEEAERLESLEDKVKKCKTDRASCEKLATGLE